MAKVNDNPTPRKRSKIETKAPKQALPKASHKSSEYVVDSEAEDAPREDKNVKKGVSNPAPAPVALSKPASSIKAQQNGAQSVVKSEKPAPQSEEDESGSEESSEDEANEPEVGKGGLTKARVNGALSKTNGVKRTASEASSSGSEESSSEEEDETQEEAEPAAKRPKTDAGAALQRSVAGVGAGVDGRIAPASRQEVAEDDGTSGPISAKPYQPPSGYTTIDLSAVRQSDSFTRSALQGKQIWHITAPSDLPLSSIKDVAADAIMSGKPVLNHKGADYVLHETDASSGHALVFVPGEDSFKPLKQRVEKSFQLQQHVVLPNLTSRQASTHTGSKAAADIAQASISNVRPQPKGMRMRYRPPGFGAGEPGVIGSESDSDEQVKGPQAQKTFQFPRTLGAHGTAESDGAAVKPKKKRKEKLKDGIAEGAGTNGHSKEASAVAAAGRADLRYGDTNAAAAVPMKKVVAPESVDGDVTMADAEALSKPSKEEKARRKEEKRMKKDAKMKGKAS